MSDRQFLITLRVVLVAFHVVALLFALNSRSTMYEMVQNAYKVTLVGAFVPLAAGVFWKRATCRAPCCPSCSASPPGSWRKPWRPTPRCRRRWSASGFRCLAW